MPSSLESKVMPTSIATIVQPVLRHWPRSVIDRAGSPVAVPGGLSGAIVWHLPAPHGELCLRRWPAEVKSVAYLDWVHAFLRDAYHQGLSFVPVPIATVDGRTCVLDGQRYWELTPWLPGEAAEAPLDAQRLAAALQALARFHWAVANNSLTDQTPRDAVSPGLQRRAGALRQLARGGARELAEVSRKVDWPSVAAHVEDIASLLAAGTKIAVAATRPWLTQALPLQPCIRDVHRDHVLFSESRVTGLVDFGAMRVENRAGDIGRLLASLVRDDARLWNTGLRAYSAVAPLVPEERAAIGAFDASATLLACANWLRWLLIERRDFGRSPIVVERLKFHATRLRELVRRGPITQRTEWAAAVESGASNQAFLGRRSELACD